MQIKRGGIGNGVNMSVKPQPDKRVVSTSWENWRVIEQKRGQAGARRGTVGRGREVRTEDLDRFMTGA
jgi:hypothetical protein